MFDLVLNTPLDQDYWLQFQSNIRVFLTFPLVGGRNKKQNEIQTSDHAVSNHFKGTFYENEQRNSLKRNNLIAYTTELHKTKLILVRAIFKQIQPHIRFWQILYVLVQERLKRISLLARIRLGLTRVMKHHGKVHMR